MRIALFAAAAVSSCVFVGCPAVSAEGEGEGEGDASEGEGEGEGGVDVGSFFAGVSGLWSGPATRTPLGDFPTMSMDLRAAADGRSLFSRADLDDDNALRFAFDVEDLDGDGTGTLVFRNGGFFLGLLRDSRTRLLDVSDSGTRWHFCSVDRGCDYIDAVWTVDADSLRLDASVLGAIHVVWDASQDEDRALPADFSPTTSSSDLPLPTLSTLTTTVRFPATDAEADVWVFLSTTPCGTTFSCTVARQKKIRVDAGATEAVVVIDQLHAGDYLVNALLDRNSNLETALRPDRGDGVASPDAAAAVDGADATAVTIVFTL